MRCMEGIFLREHTYNPFGTIESNFVLFLNLLALEVNAYIHGYTHLILTDYIYEILPISMNIYFIKVYFW